MNARNVFDRFFVDNGSNCLAQIDFNMTDFNFDLVLAMYNAFQLLVHACFMAISFVAEVLLPGLSEFFWGHGATEWGFSCPTVRRNLCR